MDGLSAFGLFAVSAMLVCYALEDRSAWFIVAFAVSCGLGLAYGFLQGAWLFGLVEAIWAQVALRRWHDARMAREASDSANFVKRDRTKDCTVGGRGLGSGWYCLPYA
jgi:hypothetical protein